MSTTVEKRVLDMQLKNSEFERNAKQTLSTIQELKNSLNFTGVGKGFDEISKSANSVKFDQLISSVGQIESKFSLLNTAVRNIFSDMVAKAVNTGSQILSAFTIEPITSGFNEYEAKIGSVQTILANTASRQKEVSQEAIQSINDEATAAVAKSKELNEEAIDNLQESQAAQDRALSKSFENQNKAYEKQAQAQTKAFEKQASKRLEAFEKETEKEVDALEKSYDQKYKALETEEDQELDLQQKNYEAKNKALEKAQKAELTTLEKAYKEQTKAYEKEMKNQLKALEDRFDSETEALEDSIDEQIDILEDQHEEELEALEEANEAEIEAIESKYDDEIEAAEEAAEAELEILEQKYDDQLDALEESSDDQLEALEDYYDDAYDALEKSQEAEQELLERNHDAKLDMYEEEYMAKLKASDEERYNKIKAIDNQINSIKNLEKAEKAESEAAERRQKLQELTQAVEQAETYTERMRAEQKLSDYKKKIAQEQRQQERDAQIDALEAQKDAVNEEYDLRAQQFKEEYDLRKESENDLYKTEKQNMSDLHKDQKEALKEQEEEEKKSLQKQIADQKEIVKEQYEYEKKLLEERKKDQTEALKEQRDAEKEAAKERQEDNKEALKDRQEDEEEALKKQTDAQKKALKDQQELEKDALKEQQDAQKEAMAETYQIQKEALEERQKQQSEALKDQNAAEKQALQESFDERKAKLDEQKDAELAALTEKRNKEKEDLNEKIEAERTALNDRIDAERSAIKDSQDAQKAALDSRQKAEMKAMKARHKQELANIESEKNARIAALNASAGKTEASSLEDVTAALDELNDYADQTIYNFEDMTRNIGTFTAAGVGLDDSVLAIKGIANLAALSGSNATQASTAMYQLSQAISAGSLKLQDWNSVVNAGMGGTLFQQALKETARAHGIEVDKMIAKEGSFRESLQHGWVTSEVLLETLSKFTGDLTDEQLKSMGYTEDQVRDIQAVAKNAVDAATKVRTWSQLIDTTKEALGSGWAETFEIIFGNFDEATNLWTEVSKQIGAIVDQTAAARNEMLTGWKDAGGRKDLIDAVKNIFSGIQQLLKPVQQAFKDIFPPVTVDTLVNITKKVKELTSRFTLSEKTSKKLRQTFKGLFSAVKLVADAFGGFFKALSPVWDVLKKVASKVLDFTADLGKLVTKVTQFAEGFDLFNKGAGAVKTALEKLFKAVGSVIEPIISKVEKFRKKVINAFTDTLDTAALFKDPFEYIGTQFDRIKNKAGELFSAIKDWVSGKIGNIDTSFIDNFKQAFINAYDTLKEKYGGISDVIDAFIGKVKELATKAKDHLDNLGISFSDVTTAIGNFTAGKFDQFFTFLEDVVDKAGSAKDAIGGLIDKIKDWVTSHFKAPDFSFIFDFIDQLTTRTVSMDKSQGAINYQELHEALFKDSDLNEMESNLTKAVDLIKQKMQWMKENLTFDDVYEAIKKVSVALIGISTIGMIRAFKGIATSVSGFVKSIKGVFTSVSDTIGEIGDVFGEVQKNLKADRYSKIAKVILTLAISLRVLASAMEVVASIDAERLKPSAIALGGLLAELAIVSGLLSKFGGDAKVNSLAVLAFAEAMKILSGPIQELGAMDLPSLAKGVGAVMTSLASLGGSSWLVSKNGFNFSAGAGLIEMASALLIVQKAVKGFASLDVNTLKKGGVAAAAGIAAISSAATAVGFSNFKTSNGVGMAIFAGSLLILQNALQKFGNMDPAEIGRGFKGLAAGLVPLVAAVVAARKGTTSGATALTIASVALIAVAKAVNMLDDISLGQVVNDLTLFAGVIGTLVIAATAAQGVWGGMMALAAAISSIGIAVAGIGAGVELFVAALGVIGTTSEAALTAVVGAFGLLATGVIQVLELLIPQVGDLMLTFIDTACNVLIEAAPQMTETVLTVVEQLLDSLIDHIPTITDQLFTLIMEVLDALEIYVPPIVQKVFDLLMKVFSAVVDALKNAPVETMLSSIVGFMLIESMMKKMAALSKVAPQALAGIAEAGVAIVELGAVLAAIGGLAQIPGLMWLLGEGTKVLQIVGHAIGEFIGAIIGGILNGISAQLPSIATNLCAFINNLKPFLEGVSAVKKKQKNGVVQLFEIIALMTGATILDTIRKYIPFATSYETLGKNLTSFIKEAEPFLNKVKDIKAKSLKGVKNLADTILMLTAADLLDGIASFITGGNSLSKFGAELEAFGPHLKAYSDSIQGLDAKAVKASSKAMKILADAADTVPNSGGKLAEWVGDNTLDDWGAELEAFGPHLKNYAESIAGVDANAVKGSASAMKILAKAAKTVPNTGGKLSELIGDNALDDWGAQLEAFGPHLKKYAEDTAGITEDSVKGSANAMKILARAARTIPNSGGIVAEFTGDNTLDSFGLQLESFGTSLKNYAESIKSVNAKKVEASAKASSMLVDMANNVPNSGGILQTWFGEKNLETFGGQLLQYGQAIKKYNKKIQGIGTKEIEASAAAGQSLVALAQNLPTDEGVFGKIFGGDKDLGSFGTQIKKFGSAMSEYYKSISSISDTSMMTSIGSIANRMVDIAVRIQDISIKDIKTLGGYIADLGSSFGDYYDDIDDIDYTKVTNSISSINAIIAMGETLKSMDTSAFEKFSSALSSLAEAGIEAFVAAFEDAEESSVSSVQKYISAVTKGITDKKDDVETGGKTAGEKVPSGFLAGMTSKSKEINDQIILITGAIVKAFTNGLQKKTFKSMGSGAVTAIKNGFSEPGSEVLSTITTLTGGIVSQFANGLKESTFSGYGRDNILGGLADGMSNSLGMLHITSGVQTVCSSIKTEFNRGLTYDQMKDIAVVAIDGMIYGLTLGQYNLNNTAYKVASGAVTTLSNNMTYDQGRNIGVGVINGLIAGISNGSYYLNNAITTVSNSGIRTFKETWQVHSPSKITYEIGDDIDSGLADGIKSGGRRIIKAAEDLSEDTQETFDDMDEGMSQSFEDSIDLSDDVAGSIGENAETAVDGMNDTGTALDAASTSTTQFSSAVNSVSVPLNNLNNLITKANQLLDGMKVKLQALATVISDFINRIKDATTESSSFTSQMKKASNKLATLSTALANATAAVKPLKTAMSKLTDTMNKVEKASNKALKSLQAYNSEYKSTNFTVPDTKSLTQSYTDVAKAQEDANKQFSDYTDYLDTSASDFDIDDYLNSAAGSYGDYLNSDYMSDFADSLGSTVGDSIDATVTDAMRDMPYDYDLDLATGELSKHVEENTKELKKSNKQSKSESKKKKKKSNTVDSDDVIIIDEGTTSSLKSIADQFAFGTSSSLANTTNSELKASKKAKEQQDQITEDMKRELSKYIGSDANGLNKVTNVENNNVFNIRSTDPKQSASEIGVILQKQVERGKAVWGL